LKERRASESLFNRVWLLLASTRLKNVLTREQQEALIAEIQRRQQTTVAGPCTRSVRGGGAISGASAARKRRTPRFWRGSDGHATGLSCTRSGRLACQRSSGGEKRPAVAQGHQQDIEVSQRTYRAWRAYSLNHDREHEGTAGERLRRMFMSDAATALPCSHCSRRLMLRWLLGALVLGVT